MLILLCSCLIGLLYAVIFTVYGVVLFCWLVFLCFVCFGFGCDLLVALLVVT